LKKKFLSTTWLGEDVMILFFSEHVIKKRGDESFFGCHVIRKKVVISYFVAVSWSGRAIQCLCSERGSLVDGLEEKR
jgi:hypothetical protein